MTESNQDVAEGNTGAASRRAVLLGAGALGAAGLLAACGDASESATATPGPSPAATVPSPGGASPTTPAADPNAIKVADIPVGSAKIFPQQKLIVAQPEAGTFKAFDATCTHQGCIVTELVGDKLRCPCHQSMYNIADGSVAQGPATSPLKQKTANVNGTTITIA